MAVVPARARFIRPAGGLPSRGQESEHCVMTEVDSVGAVAGLQAVLSMGYAVGAVPLRGQRGKLIARKRLAQSVSM